MLPNIKNHIIIEKDLKDLSLNELIGLARTEKEEITVKIDTEHLAVLKKVAKWMNETISDVLDVILTDALQ